MKNLIYLDNNATTQVDPLVLEAMLLELKGPPYNPSSMHLLGKKAKKYLIDARKTISSLLNVYSDEIIFTSGGTEALNLVIRGIIDAIGSCCHIITTDIEHPSIYNTVLHLEKKGCPVTFIKTGAYGAVKKEQIENEILKKNTKVIILSAVNSETGVITDIEAIAKVAEENNIYFIVDGVALLGKKRFSIPKGISAMGFSSHKIHGPKGVGIAYVSHNCPLHPLLLGGQQEYKRRPGTENLAGIIGTAKAFELTYQNLDENCKKLSSLRDHFENGLKQNLDFLTINGEGPRISNTSNISFNNIDAEDLLIGLDQEGVLASHGSACSSGSTQLSRVLLNMGLDKQRVKSALRFSLSRFNTLEEMEKAIKIIAKVAKNLR